MKIYLPHIHYTVYVKPRNAYKGKELITAKAITSRLDSRSCVIYADNIARSNMAGSIAHELIHVLGYICEARHITFEYEAEHMAYIMQFLFNEIRGYSYK